MAEERSLKDMNADYIRGAARDGTRPIVDAVKAAKPHTEAVHAEIKATGKRNIVLILVGVCVVMALAGALLQ